MKPYTDDALKGRSVLFFCGPWCQPCKQMEAPLERAEYSQGVPVYKVDVSAMPDVAGRYRVNNVPTLLILQDGAVTKQRTGSMVPSALLAWMAA